VAQRTIIIDDLDGSEGADLSEKNAGKFRKAMEEYVNASRRVEPTPRMPARVGRGTTRRRSTGGRSDLAEIRKWRKRRECKSQIGDASSRRS